MFYNLRITFRNLYRNRLYSAINIGGLAVSLAVCILISLWVKDELSYERFYKNGERMYRVLFLNKGSSDYWSTTPAPLAAFMQTDITQIEEYCRIGNYRNQCGFLGYENSKFNDFSMSAVDTSFFNMFDVVLISGDKHNPLPDDLAMVISESKAKLFFGDEDPVGKTLKTCFDFNFTVTGVMKDMPQNSSIKTDILVRFDVQQRTYPGNGEWKLIEEDWGNCFYLTFFKLAVNSDFKAITEKMIEKNGNPYNQYEYRLQPLHEIRLYALDGQPAGLKNVHLFSVIAALILVIACINYMNLVTARANKRSREISIRKIVGAKKINLFGQLMGEAAVMLFISIGLATALIYLLLPYYNDLAGKDMQFDLFDRSVLLIYLAVGTVALLLAGLYPAFSLTSFHPIDIFSSGAKGKGRALFRKILVVSQFTFSGTLIAGTIVIAAQLQYMQNMNKGYDKENILTTYFWGAANQYRTVMERLSSEPTIVETSASSFDKMICYWSRGDVWRNKDGLSPNFAYAIADPGFFSFMDIPVVEGSFFHEDEDFYKRGVILNETAAKLIGGGESVIGMILSFSGGDQEVVGVIKDFNFHSLHTKIAPLVINCNTEWEPNLYVKIVPGKAKEAIAAVEKVWKEYNPGEDFSYSFLDDNFDAMYKSDLRTGKLFSFFAIIAILISCFGLFGLVTYTAEMKRKEIGIRKVLGASVISIVNMLSKEFLILVGIALPIAFPLAYFWLNKMLQDYVYRISIGWWIFALTGAIMIILTLITVGWQALKAARANPVKSISKG